MSHSGSVSDDICTAYSSTAITLWTMQRRKNATVERVEVPAPPEWAERFDIENGAILPLAGTLILLLMRSHDEYKTRGRVYNVVLPDQKAL